MASRNPSLDYYEILGVPRHAAPDEIAVAYRSQIVRLRDLPGAGEQTRRLNLAYRALSNPDRRRTYDEALGGGTPFAAPANDLDHDLDQDPVPAPPPDDWENRDHVEEDEAPRRRFPALLLIAGLALALLIAGAWASGLFQSEPRMADATSGADGTAAPAGSPEAARPSSPLGEFADAIAALAPGKQRSEEAPPSPTEATAAPEGSRTTTASSADSEPAPTANESDPLAPATVTEAPAEPASEPEAAAPPEPEPPPPAQEQSPPPPPRPQIDLSSGPRLIGGALRDSDNQGGRFQGTVGVRLFIAANGRAQGCRVTRSSGNAQLDSTTCRLLQQRLFFAPARDRRGTPVASVVDSTHVWGSRRRR